MKRIFYFTGYRLKVFHWKNHTLTGELSFKPDDAGQEKFREYLKQMVNIPAKFIVDVIEEDFRIEKVPHVGSKDRKAVLKRMIDRYYRSSKQYCYDEVIGREKTGRKDDRVLIGAMTNPSLIRPWLSIIEECDVPLSGIWSLPLISTMLLNKISANKGITLLISQQVNSNVRQSLFRDGKLISSRQSIINQDIHDTEKIGYYVVPEVEKTLMFFRNQGLLSSDERVNLHIIGSDKQLSSLKQVFVSDEQKIVTVHSTADIIKKLKLNKVVGNFSDGIFSWLCCNQGLRLSHYGNASQFNHYYYSMTAKALYVASVFIFVIGFLITESNISSALGYKNEIVLLKNSEQEYKKIYSQKYKAFEGIFENADMMNSAVMLARRIQHNTRTSPLDFMLQLSNVLSDNNLPDVEIDKIHWLAINTDEKQHANSGGRGSGNVNFTEKTPILHRATINGRINVAQNNYRESIGQVNAIINALKKQPDVISVVVKTMPVDLRSNSKFSTESGINIKGDKWRELTGMFSLQITMRASDND